MNIQKEEDEDSNKMMNFSDFFYFKKIYILKNKLSDVACHITIFSIKK
jgi:hypothetical protein